MCVVTITCCFNFSGSWKQRTFKEYNFDAMGIPPVRGHLHPLMKVRAQYRQIFLEMGLVGNLWISEFTRICVVYKCVCECVCVCVCLCVCVCVCVCCSSDIDIKNVEEITITEIIF